MRPYAKLRGKMREYGDTSTDIGRLLLITPQTVSCKLNNRSAWTLPEAYAILDRYGIDHRRLTEYFPRNGRNE